MAKLFQIIVSVFTTIFMLPSMLGVALFGTDNVNTNTYGEVRPRRKIYVCVLNSAKCYIS